MEHLMNTESDPSLVSSLIGSLNIEGTERFKAAKELSFIAKEHPNTLYAYFDSLAKLLDSRSSVLLWNGLLILGYLAPVDTQHRLDLIIEKYLLHLQDKKLVTAANVVIGAGQILLFRPDLTERILPQMLSVDEISLPTYECHQVIRGHVLSAFIDCVEGLKDDSRVLMFAQKCTQSYRPSTRKKAQELIQKLSNKW